MAQNTFPKDVRDRLADLVIDGEKTTREVAAEHGVHQNTVQGWAATRRRERGMPAPARNGQTVEGVLKRLQKVEQKNQDYEAELEQLRREYGAAHGEVERLREELDAERQDNGHLRATIKIFSRSISAPAVSTERR